MAQLAKNMPTEPPQNLSVLVWFRDVERVLVQRYELEIS